MARVQFSGRNWKLSLNPRDKSLVFLHARRYSPIFRLPIEARGALHSMRRRTRGGPAGKVIKWSLRGLRRNRGEGRGNPLTLLLASRKPRRVTGFRRRAPRNDDMAVHGPCAASGRNLPALMNPYLESSILEIRQIWLGRRQLRMIFAGDGGRGARQSMRERTRGRRRNA